MTFLLLYNRESLNISVWTLIVHDFYSLPFVIVGRAKVYGKFCLSLVIAFTAKRPPLIMPPFDFPSIFYHPKPAVWTMWIIFHSMETASKWWMQFSSLRVAWRWRQGALTGVVPGLPVDSCRRTSAAGVFRRRHLPTSFFCLLPNIQHFSHFTRMTHT